MSLPAALRATELHRLWEALHERLSSGRVVARVRVGPLATLADEVTGDPHALDDGTRLGAVVLRALSSVFNVDLPDSSEERRLLWQRAGVADDELSSVVLAAGLRLSGAGVAASLTTACADAGQAVALTLAHLRTSELRAVPTEVWVVENPSIIAMATLRFGPRCPPVVCTSGWPNTAVMLLLRQLAESGARLHYHGDFDGEGLRIAAYVMDKTGAVPWRMSARDYLGACRPNAPDPGRVTQAPWDSELADTVRAEQRTVSEEQVAGVLLQDLAESAPGFSA
jgi:uncharacterized protein (TIGR02679 family)